jgi:1-deoxy-D-xylulose-5-phosphate reductoisomerase
VRRLDFDVPDRARFPCLELAFRALRGDAGLPIVLNAANEVAVASFLENRLRFTAIPDLIRLAMDAYEDHGAAPVRTLADVRAVDEWARDFAVRSTSEVQSRV